MIKLLKRKRIYQVIKAESRYAVRRKGSKQYIDLVNPRFSWRPEHLYFKDCLTDDIEKAKSVALMKSSAKLEVVAEYPEAQNG